MKRANQTERAETRPKDNKGEMHPRNPHRGRYDLERLAQSSPELAKEVVRNKYGDLTVDFFKPSAVKALNRAILSESYGVKNWDIPPTAIVPPIPGRAEYIHQLSDVIGQGKMRCLDIGVGANCIYPIIGVRAYGWEFVGSDISESSLANAATIVANNEVLHGSIELRHQSDHNAIFDGVIAPNDHFDATLCNPPFHDSEASAKEGTQRKLRNLKGLKTKQMERNFAGDPNELWCEGGELSFITRMIHESRHYRKNCRYFSTLVSKESNLPRLRREISSVGATSSRVIEMNQGNKRSRILIWRF